MNADTLTYYGVECLLRLKGVQVKQIQCRKSALIRVYLRFEFTCQSSGRL
jgi:hypothetical protein